MAVQSDIDAVRHEIAACIECARQFRVSTETGPLSTQLTWFVSMAAHRGLTPSDVRIHFVEIASASGVPVQRLVELANRSRATSQPFEASPLTTALLAGDSSTVRRMIAEHIRAGANLETIAETVIQPAMQEIGRMWEQNQISFEREHLATAVCQSVMAQFFSEIDFAPPNSRRAVFACVPGNRHVVGPRLVADSFETHGWDVSFLGADVSIDRLIAVIESERPELVGLSVALPQDLESARSVIDELDRRFGSACPKIVVGGAATLEEPNTARIVGAEHRQADVGSICKLAGGA